MRVAIVSYYAPPDPAVASHRVLRLTRSLIDAGHEVHWVTLDAAQLLRSDETLRQLIPPGVVRHALGGPTLASRPAARNLRERVLRTLYHKLPEWFALPDKHLEWASRLRRSLPALARAQDFDAVVVSCGPHGQLSALPRLRKAVPDAKLVVDYRDLLCGNPWTQPGSARVRERLQARERAWLAVADVLYVNSIQAKERFEQTFDGLEVPVEVMRNAADYALADEVVASVSTVAPPASSAPCVLGYFGTIFPRRMLTPLFAAMEQLDPAVLEQLRVEVYCDAGDSRALLERDLENAAPSVAVRVIRRDYLPYAQALAAMRAASALVLVNGQDPSDSVFVPGKLFDYVMARRPTLFVGGGGDARDIVAKTSGSAWCFEHGDANGLSDAIARLVEGVSELDPVPELSRDHTFAPLLSLLEAR
ncbi:MAG: glycosyltransferase [Planctomycetota bacterium]|nr:glycosyltransferase [Planctomycetota bacterium]